MTGKDYKNEDKSSGILWMTIAVAVILVVMNVLPPFYVNDIQFRRTGLVSPFFHFSDDNAVSASSDEWVEDGVLYQSQSSSSMSGLGDSCSVADALEKAVMGDMNTDLTEILVEEASAAIPANSPSCLEEYGISGEMMGRFLHNLNSESGTRNIRIAFLGDSFIEGDILTSSLRNDLQEKYGGEGVGFVPFADPIAKYRVTVKQEYEGWTCYNLLRKKNVPAKYQSDFYMSGYISVPQSGAKSTFRSGSYHGRPIVASHARIIFKNRGEGIMDVVVNDGDTVRYNLPKSNEVQYIDVSHQGIAKLAVSLPVCHDFVGYGVVFEGDNGVVIDNYGLRSHSGINLLSTAYDVNTQIGDMRNYDLVVLEYGLNAMQKTVTQYGGYTEKLKKVVAYVRRVFPESAIMMMSIGDVGMKVDGRIITAPAVPAMVNGQRSVARQCDISFLNMYQGMGGSGSMKQFVDNGWASKDYLHINARGGDRLAKILLDTMLHREKENDTQEVTDI